MMIMPKPGKVSISWTRLAALSSLPATASTHMTMALARSRSTRCKASMVRSGNVIVIGHCRVLAAKMIGLDVVPVVSADDLTEDEIRELRIVDNKTNESPWNDYLEEDLHELTFEGFDFDTLENQPGGVLPDRRSWMTNTTENRQLIRWPVRAMCTSWASTA